ncbi:MAG: serine/threonine protein kinase [Planctomycetaceae bacterium]|nr:serine/threonine protein kinase [Planctomycetaceae bacterium]
MSALLTDLSNLTIADGRYLVREKFGKGSMGHIFRAFDTRPQTEVVIKVPTDRRLADLEFHQRFLQESRLLTQLNHPHIVKILDVGEHEGVPFFVMPYIDDGNLLDRMQQTDGTLRPMPLDSLADWLRSTAEALDFMHRKGYIHRDVKPANILFDTHGQVYLSDFGLSKILLDADHDSSGLTAANAVVGTPNYVAPELVLARKNYDGRADQYSLAVTVYEALTGKPPLEGGSPTATMVNQTTKHPRLLHEVNPEIPESLASVVRMAMSKRPWRRYETCVAFADAVLTSARDLGGADMSASSRSSSTGYATVVGQRPAFIVAATSRGKNGVIPCPGCGEELVLKAKYAGQKGSCIHCGGRLQISPGLNELKLLKPLNSACPALDSQVVIPVPLAADQTEIAFGDEVFGLRFTNRFSLLLTVTGVALLCLIALIIGRQSAHWSSAVQPPAAAIESRTSDRTSARASEAPPTVPEFPYHP